MTAARAERRQVSRVFHPEPQGELLELPSGANATVLAGDEPAYQLSTGEMIAIHPEGS